MIKFKKSIVGGLAAASLLLTACGSNGPNDTIKTGPYEGQNYSETLDKMGVDVPSKDYYLKVCGYMEQPAKDGKIDDAEFKRLTAQVGRDLKLNPERVLLDAGDVGSVIGASIVTGCEDYMDMIGSSGSSLNNT